MDDRFDLFPVAPNPSRPPASILEISNYNISRTGHAMNFLFGFRVGEPNSAISVRFDQVQNGDRIDKSRALSPFAKSRRSRPSVPVRG